MSIKLPPFLALAASSLLALTASVHAQTTVTTDPVGFNTVSLLGQSDTLVSVPFTRAPEFVGTISSVSGNVVTVSGTTGWTNNQFVYVSGTQSKTYYALIGNNATTNPKEGRIFTITANSTTALTLNLSGDDISSVAAGTAVKVIPYWTLATVFPSSDAGTSFVATTSLLSKKTEIYIPNYSGTGVNLASAKSYYFYNNAWRQTGKATTEVHDDDVLLPGAYVKVRQNDATTTNLTTIGSVPMGKLCFGLATSGSSQQDNYLATLRPVDVSLNNTGLISSGAFTVTTSLLNKQDMLYVYDNSVAGFNKASSASYYYYNGAWRKTGQSVSVDFGNDTLGAANGFVIRKATAAGGVTQFWTQASTY